MSVNVLLLSPHFYRYLSFLHGNRPRRSLVYGLAWHRANFHFPHHPPVAREVVLDPGLHHFPLVELPAKVEQAGQGRGFRGQVGNGSAPKAGARGVAVRQSGRGKVSKNQLASNAWRVQDWGGGVFWELQSKSVRK